LLLGVTALGAAQEGGDPVPDPEAAGPLTVHFFETIRHPDGRASRAFEIRMPDRFQGRITAVYQDGQDSNVYTVAQDMYQFVYVPPHDEQLKQQGMTATRTDTLFTRVMVRGQHYDLTYLLDVHRSWRGEENHGGTNKAGLPASVLYSAALRGAGRHQPGQFSALFFLSVCVRVCGPLLPDGAAAELRGISDRF
jgi:hypothetical protein